MIDSLIQKHMDLRRGNPHRSLKTRKERGSGVAGEEKGIRGTAVEGLECHTKEASWKDEEELEVLRRRKDKVKRISLKGHSPRTAAGKMESWEGRRRCSHHVRFWQKSSWHIKSLRLGLKDGRW